MESIKQYITEDLLYLTENKKIIYKGKNLKCDRIITFVHDLIMRTYTQQTNELNLWSTILQKKYGHDYKKIIEFLEEKKFMEKIYNYCSGKKSNTYRILLKDRIVKRCKITDKVILKSINKSENIQNIIKYSKSPIECAVREKMAGFLSEVEIDYDKSLEYLDNSVETCDITENKYYINIDSIDRIKKKRLFLKFDEYGRMHTNFTTLKKNIRSNFLKIDNSLLREVDIKNSQPFFFAIFLKEELGYSNFNDECKKYYDLCKEGLIYDYILENSKEFSTRNEIKIMMYTVLFGNNSVKKLENKVFKSLFPSVFEYIKEFKGMVGNYKELSHKLQLMESNFIFNVVIKKILIKFPYVKVVTIHDSIMFPECYKNEVNLVFNEEFKKLITI